MDLYTVLKFLHIVGAIAWIGGGVTLCVLAVVAERQRNEQEVLRILGSVGFLANRWFVPASLLALVCGIAMTAIGGLWDQAWIVLGLVGFLATFATGHFVLRIKAMAAKKLVDEGNIPGAFVEGRKMLQIAKFDYTMLFMVVADMVLKPTWTDFLSLGFIAIVLAAGAYFFLLGGLRSEPVAA